MAEFSYICVMKNTKIHFRPITNLEFEGAKTITQLMAYTIFLPLFFLGFTLLYNPFGIKEYCNFGGFGYGFHLLMFTAIILVTTAISRAIMIPLREKMGHRGHEIWGILEATACTVFITLYTAIFNADIADYFEFFAVSAKYTYLVLIYPYALLWLLQALKFKDKQLENTLKGPESALVKFYDEHKRLKLTVSAESLLCISAEINYIKISFTDGDRVKSYLLRNSMKSQEATDRNHGLVRCHRSWFVNPSHVKLLSRDNEGFIHAELDSPEPISVPVSKQYFEILSNLL